MTLTISILILIFTLLRVKTVKGECISLTNSTVCSAFSQFYISLPDLYYDYPFLFNSTTIEEFDQSILHYINSTSAYLYPLGCLSSNYNPTIPYARYSITKLCAAILQNPTSSLPCNFERNLQPPPLCQHTCKQWIDSVTDITSDSKVCSNQTQRDSTLLAYQDQCDFWEGLNGTITENCISGIANEPNNCGFGQSSIACVYCREHKYDTCCADINCKYPLSVAAITGIIIASITCITIIFGIYYCHYHKRKKAAKELNYASKPGIFCLKTRNTKNKARNLPFKIDHNDSSSSTTRIDLNTRPETMKGLCHIPSTHTTAELGGSLPIEEFYFVRYEYQTQRADELVLNVGDIICLFVHYDDGWAFGLNATTGKKGAFPSICILPAPEEDIDQLLSNQDDAPHTEDTTAIHTTHPNHTTDTTDTINDHMNYINHPASNYSHSTTNGVYPTSSELLKSSLATKYGYIEANSPSSPTFHTPFFTTLITKTDKPSDYEPKDKD
ncbi:hypothetical protein BDB01DRAFT_770071 [Pilobolus umbonatus]|nr:hypothetical protein BDB01DRAFT_770071 [Pilobolus umbonatus]